LVQLASAVIFQFQIKILAVAIEFRPNQAKKTIFWQGFSKFSGNATKKRRETEDLIWMEYPK
jgi:hypothetical protein